MLVNLNEMQFGFMPGNKTVDAIFIVRRMQEEYQKKDKKLYMCFVDMEKSFDRMPRKVIEWTLRKKGLSEVIVRAAMSRHFASNLYFGVIVTVTYLTSNYLIKVIFFMLMPGVTIRLIIFTCTVNLVF